MKKKSATPSKEDELRRKVAAHQGLISRIQACLGTPGETFEEKMQGLSDWCYQKELQQRRRSNGERQAPF